MLVRPATPADRSPIARALGSAFADDPLFRWMTGAQGSIERRMVPFFATFLGQNLRRADHLVFVADDGSGAAVWQPVDRWRVPPLDLLRAAPTLVRTFRHRLPVMAGALTTIEKAHPSEPHYYLEFLGTRADRQGKGVGTSVIEPMLERCDREGLPAYLESSNPRNIPFYARHGFTVRDELECGRDAPPCTTMWRDPRG